MSVLNKSAVIDQLAEKTGVSKAAAARSLEALQEIIMDGVAEGNAVKLTGFASFEPSVRAAREMKNPKTGEPIDVPETKVVKIRPMQVFRNKVAGK